MEPRRAAPRAAHTAPTSSASLQSQTSLACSIRYLCYQEPRALAVQFGHFSRHWSGDERGRLRTKRRSAFDGFVFEGWLL